jgi:hypothetical protein
MVKQSFPRMLRFFTRERFGTPQIIAGLLLVFLIAQCAWLITREHSGAVLMSENEFARVEQGIAQWRGHGIAGTPLDAEDNPEFGLNAVRYDPEHSPLWYLIPSFSVAIFRISPESWLWIWLTRVPYVLAGVLLGASLWYVARRLYGNAGGYCALALFCFSPLVIRNCALWFTQPGIPAAWGTFGAVFTAIAVTHTLYAPREVVLWNWRRILLLGISLALAVGSDFRAIVIVPVILVFMLYLVPERWKAACTILGAACAAAFLLLLAAYFFHARIFWKGMEQAKFWDLTISALRIPGAYVQVLQEIAASGPVLVVLFPAALLTFFVWRRCRYFGNIAPLLVAALFLVLRIVSPHDANSVFTLIAVVFLFVFVAGIAADALETKGREPVMAVLAGLLAGNAIWNLMALARIGG